jgi:hypothetical protein
MGPLSVRVVPRAHFPEKARNKKGWAGYYDGPGFAIYVVDDLAPNVAWQIFLHERNHALLDLYGIQLPEKAEEAICTLFATLEVQGMLGK